jgi:predicted nucleotidyltransferase
VKHDPLLQAARERLQVALGDRLRGVLFYGSGARGEAGPDSDLDLLVLLDGPVDLGQDLERIIGALYPLQLESEQPIHAIPVDYALYAAGQYALHRHAQREGILL